MKKIIILAAAAAMFIFASCQKEEVTPRQNSQSEELVFTATIDQNSRKTTINTNISDTENRGKIYWVEGDEITITDKDSKSAVYVAQSGGSTTTTFKIKSGETALGEGPYSATYKAAPEIAQAYTDYYSAANTAKDLYMTASSTSGTTLTFKAACGLLKLTLTASGDNAKDISKDISKIEFVGTPTYGSATVYTLTCDNESIESAKDFYIALPAGSYNLMKFTNSKGSVCFKKNSTGMTIEDNDLQPVILSGITFSAVLPGQFTVASGKQVQFVTANLYWDSSAFKFEASQTDYDKGTSDGSTTTYTPTHVSHFYWTKTAAASYAATYDDGTCDTSDKFFADGSDASHSLTIDGQSGLYALSSAEWTYLLNTKSAESGARTGNRFAKAMVHNVKGLIIFPDGYTTVPSDAGIAGVNTTDAAFPTTSIASATWSAMESAGCVFLPAAGCRVGSDLNKAGSNGCYWSATPSENGKNRAGLLGFLEEGVQPSGYVERSYGGSVRLVKGYAPVYPEAPSLACVKIGDVWWAPVNCGYDATSYPYGKLYQWGRHDGCGYNDGSTYKETLIQENYSTGNTQVDGSTVKEDATKFYWGSSLPRKDWLATKDDTRWNSGTEDVPVKTTYDPCPEGWRVPTFDELGNLCYTDWNSSSKCGTSTRGSWDGTKGGWNFDTLFLPAAGCRFDDNGNASNRGATGSGSYWSLSPSTDYTDNAERLYFTCSTANMSYGTYRARGCSVRCVQE